MGRQANFSELRDAIRQGQAKIAQGLKTGQMRSDRDKADAGRVPRLDPAHEVLGQKPTLTGKVAIFQGRKKPRFRFSLPKLPKIRIRLPQMSLLPMRSVVSGIAAVLVVGLVVFIVFWIGKILVGSGTTSPVAEVDPPVRQPAVAPGPSAPVLTTERQSAPVERQSPQETAAARTETVQPPQTPAVSTPSTGNNVIVIQGITTARENELLSVQEFFARHGIETEIIRGGNNYSRLVTKGRFENPNRPGTDGYEMRMRIRNIGKRYPAETGDTKFGAEPFQDAYGLLRQ
ncbi:MAG TPA: hypothetical protein ENN97_04470 [Phycisphaerales bacterium]|nr:hypothetical protein [Phycisphaerales bacterium]